MEQISQELRQALKAAGWTSGRSVDPRPFWILRARSDFVPHSAAEAFFREFGGLALESSTPGPIRPIRRSLDLRRAIDISAALPLAVERLQEHVGNLVPIFGSETWPPTIFVMAPEGKAYAFVDGDDPGQVIWGPWESGMAALDAYLVRRRESGSWPITLGSRPAESHQTDPAQDGGRSAAMSDGLDDLPLI